jgi:hypothetical protein
METHPCPEKAWSDGPNSWPLQRMESLLATLVALDKAEDLLARDVLSVDLRNDKRPVLRLAPFALNEHRKEQGIDVSGSEL